MQIVKWRLSEMVLVIQTVGTEIDPTAVPYMGHFIVPRVHRTYDGELLMIDAKPPNAREECLEGESTHRLRDRGIVLYGCRVRSKSTTTVHNGIHAINSL